MHHLRLKLALRHSVPQAAESSRHRMSAFEWAEPEEPIGRSMDTKMELGVTPLNS